MSTLEKFEEKSILELSEIAGGKRIEDTNFCFSVHWDGFFNGNLNLFDGIKKNTVLDELD